MTGENESVTPQVCDDHRRNPARVYSRCIGCELDDLRKEVERLRTIVDPLNRLREDEGNVVMFICPNPDFNGLPDEAIEVVADWTGWKPARFTGRTLAECLAAAERARKP